MKKWFGDRKFYKMVLGVAIPIIVQNMITNFVSLLDNVMVGRIGTEQMSGVSIVNQILFVFNLALFGAVSGAGIFTAQYAGQQNHDGVRNTMRFKMIVCFAILIAGAGVLYFFRTELISLYLHKTEENLDLEATLGYAKDYLMVMLIGLIPFAFANAYSSTLRETGQTTVPMIAGIVATLVNLFFNYVLIFGHFGAPKMGVVGAAIATVLARYIELFIMVIWTHRNEKKNPFAAGLYKSLAIPRELFGKIVMRGTPLFCNEFLWAFGMSMLLQRYSTRGLNVVAAFNISNTINNLFNVVMIAMGSVVAIIIGQILGSGDMEKVVETDNRLIVFSLILCTGIGAIEFAVAPLFPRFYETSDSIRALATQLMRVSALFVPVGSFLNTAYFTLRSGGKTFITFLFDSFFVIAVSVPVAFVLSKFTDMPIVPMYFCVQCFDFLKVLIGIILLKKRIWIQNLVEE